VLTHLELGAGPGFGKVLGGHHALHEAARKILAPIAEDVARRRYIVLVAQLVHPPAVKEMVLDREVVETKHFRVHLLRPPITQRCTHQRLAPPVDAVHGSSTAQARNTAGAAPHAHVTPCATLYAPHATLCATLVSRVQRCTLPTLLCALLSGLYWALGLAWHGTAYHVPYRT
jgi:hypothetical protein